MAEGEYQKDFLIKILTHFHENYQGKDIKTAVDEKLLHTCNELQNLTVSELLVEKTLIANIMYVETRYIKRKDNAKKLFEDVVDLLGGECVCGGDGLDCNEDCCPVPKQNCQQEILTNLKEVLDEYIQLSGKMNPSIMDNINN